MGRAAAVAGSIGGFISGGISVVEERQKREMSGCVCEGGRDGDENTISRENLQSPSQQTSGAVIGIRLLEIATFSVHFASMLLAVECPSYAVQSGFALDAALAVVAISGELLDHITACKLGVEFFVTGSPLLE